MHRFGEYRQHLNIKSSLNGYSQHVYILQLHNERHHVVLTNTYQIQPTDNCFNFRNAIFMQLLGDYNKSTRV